MNALPEKLSDDPRQWAALLSEQAGVIAEQTDVIARKSEVITE